MPVPKVPILDRIDCISYFLLFQGFQVHLPFFPVLKAGELSQAHAQEKVKSSFLLLSVIDMWL